MTENPGNPYLEEAAYEFIKAREDNEKRTGLAADMAGMKRPVEGERILAEVNDRRMEIADGFTRLAAIKAGLPPCWHRTRPEPGQETS